MPGCMSARERPTLEGCRKGGRSKKTPGAPGFVRLFPTTPLRSLCLALARWAASGLFQLKPATPAWTALAVLPMPAMSPCTHVLRYPGPWLFLSGLPFAGSGGSLTHANSLDERWVPIQLTLSCLSPEVQWFLLLDDLPPRQPSPPVPFPPLLVCSLVGVPPSVSPALSGPVQPCSQVRSHLEGDDRRSH